MHCWLDRLLIPLFAFTAFMALIYAPAFMFSCGWDGLSQGIDGPCGESAIGRAWLGYLQVEPIYANAPLWLRLVNAFDTYLFGWFYLLSLGVFLRGRQDAGWYRGLATFMAGMMSYAMALYLTWETLTFRETGAQIVQVFVYNGLWLLIFALLMARIHLWRPGSHRTYGARVAQENA